MFGASPVVAAQVFPGVCGTRRPRGRPGRTGRDKASTRPGRAYGHLTKADMPLNDALPEISVDPDSFAVWVNGELVTEDPATELPMAQRYFLF